MPKKGYKHTEETRRKMSETKRGKPNGRLGIRFSEEHKKKLSLAKLGKKRKPFSPETIRKMSEYAKKIGRKPIPMSGENHWHWQGGKTFAIYSINWTETLRRSIRERDKYTCRLCGKLQGDRAHCIHHIDYNKLNCNPENLITLCNTCNTRVNFNREYWINYFKQIFGEKITLNYL